MSYIVILSVSLAPILVMIFGVHLYLCHLSQKAAKRHDELQRKFTECQVTLATGKTQRLMRETRQPKGA